MPRPAPIVREGPPLTLVYEPLGGEAAEMDALAFASFLTESVRALRQIAVLISGKPVQVQYTISDLDKNSPDLVKLTPRVRLEDVPLIEQAQVQHIRTVAALQEGRVLSDLDFPALQTYLRLGGIAKTHRFVARVQTNGASAQVSRVLKDRLDLELKKDVWAYGSVRGRVRSYHAAGWRRLIRLYPRVGPAVVCHFKREHQEMVVSLIEKFAMAEGRMRYRPNEYHPYHMEIESISEIDRSGAPTFADMEGFARNLAGDTPAEDFIREARDEW